MNALSRLMLLLACGTLCAQQDPTIRLDVQQVLIPVVVTDKKGHQVSGLRASDFQIYEDGTAQNIASFSADAGGAPAETGARRTFVFCVDTLHTAPANAAHVREALESLFEKEKAGDAQYVLISIGRQMQVLQAATANPLALTLKLRGAGFQNAMGGLDGAALSSELQNLRSRMDEFCKRCPCGTRAAQRTCDAEIDTLKQSVDSQADGWTAPTNAMLGQFTSVVEELAKLPTARTLILVSDGFDVDPRRAFYAAVAAYLPSRSQFRTEDTRETGVALHKALEVASERNVAIYTVDSRGGSAATLASTGALDAGASSASGGGSSILGTNRAAAGSAPSLRSGGLQSTAGPQANPFRSEASASMEELARATGGVYFHDGSDMLKQFRGVLADGRENYVLAYVPKNSAQDGTFRRITVEIKGRNLNIRAKEGYWASGTAQ